MSKNGEIEKDLHSKANREYHDKVKTIKEIYNTSKFCRYSSDLAEPSFEIANHKQDSRYLEFGTGHHPQPAPSHGVLSHAAHELVFVIRFLFCFP